MSTLDENGNVKRDADTIARLHAELIAAVPELTRLRAVPQPWGLVALHFDAALDDQEVLVKVGIRSKEAQTMRDLYRVAPDLVPRMYVEGTLASGLHYAAFERIRGAPSGLSGKDASSICCAPLVRGSMQQWRRSTCRTSPPRAKRSSSKLFSMAFPC